MATEIHTSASASASAMSQLQSIQKVMAFPTVGAAVGQVGAIYTRVKGKESQSMIFLLLPYNIFNSNYMPYFLEMFKKVSFHKSITNLSHSNRMVFSDKLICAFSS